MIRHTKDRLAPVAVQPGRSDILQKLRESLSAAYSDDMWNVVCPGYDSLEAEFDSRLLDGALLELVHNSRQCSPTPDNLRITIHVHPQARSGEEWVVVRYSDNGPGVPAGLKDRVFDNFFSQRPGRETGTGLGLGYVRRIIEAHGGTIEERGQHGRGVRFAIRIPRYVRVSETVETEN